MANRFELDVRDLAMAARANPRLSGLDVLGPRERIIGSTGHEYRLLDDGSFAHMQNFHVLEPYSYRVVRRNCLTFQFTIGGAFEMRCGDRSFHFRAATARISGFPVSTTLVAPTQRGIVGVGMFIDRQTLIDRYGLLADRLPERYRPLFTSPAGSAISLELPLPATIWIAIEQIVRCAFPEPLRSAYLNARYAELICEVVAMLNALRPYSSVGAVTRGEREDAAIQAAAAIYRREIAAPPSVEEIARRVGVNRNKLSDGFRERFGDTPAQFSRRARLDWARARLADSDLSVAQVAFAAGYGNAAAFSRAYAALFGAAPSATRGGA